MGETCKAVKLVGNQPWNGNFRAHLWFNVMNFMLLFMIFV